MIFVTFQLTTANITRIVIITSKIDFTSKISAATSHKPSRTDQGGEANQESHYFNHQLVYKSRLFGNLQGGPCMWRCFAGETRKTPPHLPIAVQNPKDALYFRYFPAFA
jgi:hypothetical protein